MVRVGARFELSEVDCKNASWEEAKKFIEYLGPRLAKRDGDRPLIKEKARIILHFM